MTKKLLLAAGAVAALAFAGAANAGTLSNSSISGVGVSTAPYTVASEVTDPVAGTPSASGAVILRNKLTNPATVNAAATVNYVVKFTLAGNAKFVAGAGTTPATTPTLTVYDNGTNPAAITSGVSTQNISPAGGGSVEFLVTFNPASNATIGAFEISGYTLAVSAEGDVSVTSTVEQAAGGSFVTIDSLASTKIIQYKAALAAPTATTQNVLAGLPDFKAFKAAPTAPATLDNQIGSSSLYRTAIATGFSVALNSGTTFYRNLTGTAITAASDIVSSAVVNVTGTNLDKLSPTVGTATPAAGVTATAASFALTGTPALGSSFSLTEPTAAADRVVLQAGSYTATYLPTYANGFTAPTSALSLGSLLNVSLDGTNFIAPWFTLNNPNNAATLRLANNGTAATGPVIIALKANNGTAAATNSSVTVAQSIAAGATLEITGPQLATLLGTNAQNGDLQVTVQGDGAVISGKVRVRNVSGATFEASLGNLGK